MTNSTTDIERSVTVVAVDPGAHTGIAVVSCRKSWLAGVGLTNYQALGRACSFPWWEEVGREPKCAVVPEDGFDPSELSDEVEWIGREPSVDSGPPLAHYTEEDREIVARCQAILNQWPNAAFVHEDFFVLERNSSRDYISPVRILAMLEESEHLVGHDRRPYVQASGVALSTGNDDRLRAAGLYRPGLRHANDAMAHAVTFLRSARASKRVRRSAWPHVKWS